MWIRSFTEPLKKRFQISNKVHKAYVRLHGLSYKESGKVLRLQLVLKHCGPNYKLLLLKQKTIYKMRVGSHFTSDVNF